VGQAVAVAHLHQVFQALELQAKVMLAVILLVVGVLGVVGQVLSD
jgi:hypothetical protein